VFFKSFFHKQRPSQLIEFNFFRLASKPAHNLQAQIYKTTLHTFYSPHTPKTLEQQKDCCIEAHSLRQKYPINKKSTNMCHDAPNNPVLWTVSYRTPPFPFQ
jgi:hypothetical protein